jgi:hypothetical protein
MIPYAQSAATVPEPCEVLGTPMRPFCLGHHLLFKRLNLPFCGNSLSDAGDDEVLVGIAICGQSYEDTLEQLLTGTWAKVFERWKLDLTKTFCPKRFFLFRQTIEKSILSEAKVLFRAYLEDGYQQPPVYKYVTVKGVELSAPWELILKNRLIIAGYTTTEVLNGYLPSLWYDYYSIMELEAADKCSDPAKWRKIFYDERDAKALGRLKHSPPLKEEK